MSTTATTLGLLLAAAPAPATQAGTAAIGAPPADCIRASGNMPDRPLTLRNLWRFSVTVDVDPAWEAKTAGMPGLLIQFDVPDAIHLQGPYLKTHEELARNEFMQRPLERFARPGLPVKAGFHRDELVEGESIGINVFGYLRKTGADPDDSEAWFVHRRFELPIRRAAEIIPGDPADYSWSGVGLKVGDMAPGFSLPRADGTRVTLSEYRGKKDVIVTTYRAFW